MNKTPRVSIILPTYNRSSLVRRCVDSILKQTYTNWELIISDDGSIDDTATTVMEFTKLDSRIKVNINANNQGSPRNRNIALAMATGELTLYIEDDLILHPDFLEVMVDTYNLLRSRGIRAIVVPRLIEKIDQRSEAVNQAAKQNVPFLINKWTGEIFNNYSKDFGGKLMEVVIGHACSLYDTSILREVRGYTENTYKRNYCREESDLQLRLAKKGYRYYFQPKAVADHAKINTGGCRISDPLSQTYYYARNHIVFLVKIFGIKSVYMIPCFLLELSRRIIRNNLKTHG